MARNVGRRSVRQLATASGRSGPESRKAEACLWRRHRNIAAEELLGRTEGTRPTAAARALTLVELLVVIAIIGLLIAYSCPPYRPPANRPAACNAATTSSSGPSPRRCTTTRHKHLPLGSTVDFWLWRPFLLPFMEEGANYDQYIARAGNFDGLTVSTGYCPSDRNAFQLYQNVYSLSNYFGNEGTKPYPNPGGGPPAPYDGVLFMGGYVRFGLITDGLSRTILLGERGMPDDLFWGWLVWGTGDPGIQDGTGDAMLATQNGLAAGNSLSPADTDVEHYWSYHPGGANLPSSMARCNS